MSKLKHTVRVGNTVFKAGVDESLVIACAKRAYESTSLSKSDIWEMQEAYDNKTLSEVEEDIKKASAVNAYQAMSKTRLY